MVTSRCALTGDIGIDYIRRVRVLVTGVSGFIGASVAPLLAARGHGVRSVRRDSASLDEAFAGCEAVIHLANIAHTKAGRALLWRVNVDGTRRVAEFALKHGLRRMVYLSSIKASGEQTADRRFDGSEPGAPQDDYGRAKLAAERTLFEIAARSAANSAGGRRSPSRTGCASQPSGTVPARIALMLAGLGALSFVIAFVAVRVLLSRFGRFALDEPNARTPHPKLRVAQARTPQNGKLLQELLGWLENPGEASPPAVRAEVRRWVPECMPPADLTVDRERVKRAGGAA